MRNTIYFILSGILLCSACASQKQQTKKLKWEGNWEWVSSFGGIAGHKRTPASTETQLLLRIEKDSIFQYENGTLTSTWPSKLHYGKLILQEEPSWYFLKNDIKVAVQIQDSMLILNEDCSDCYEHRYVKQQN